MQSEGLGVIFLLRLLLLILEDFRYNYVTMCARVIVKEISGLVCSFVSIFFAILR